MVNIKVAVRIRPMSERELKHRDSEIVSNSEKCIFVTNPKMSEKSEGVDSRQRIRRFAVDYCYDPKYPELATQEAVFEEIGTEVLGHMFEGYNACVLAYGHSASGKTYTMMGQPDDPGLTPRICRELCRRMQANATTAYLVTVSFLEIYNEKVRDLLIDEDPNQTSSFSLRVREHPKLGPYVQDLSEHVIELEEELLALLSLGYSRRSTAATESNVHSSRSHAVFTIRFKQVGANAAKSSKVHLVDLAGSERAGGIQSRARLKEGANINKSLVTLGNVISALAESCEPAWGKGWQPFVPYRDSVLTWLLKDTLGGNSNTIMIATISPASSCYSDTINTLRYAKRTKRIVNQPTVNEDPKVRTIRELRDEVSRLKAMLLSFTSHQTELAEMETPPEAASSSKWQEGRATLCAVGLQTEDVDYPPIRWTAGGLSMGTQLANDLLGHLAATPSSPGHLTPEETVRRNIATLDILPENKQSSCVPALHVSEINGNAGNGTGVNRVIADPIRLWELSRQKAGSCGSGVVPRVGRPPFKRKRAPLRRGTLYWSMLHRSRPDLIKGIGTRATEAPSTSGQGLAEALSQSTSDVSIHSSGSTEFRPRLHPAASLSRTSSVGDASGSSTPTQPSRPSVRKKENKRAEIVASVTSRLYAIKKKPDPRQEALLVAEKEDEEDDELEELKLCKRARMKLFDLSRKLAMAKKVKRTVDSDTQTEMPSRTLRVKEKSVATEKQGILHVQNCATNTPADPSLMEPDPPVVMNHVFLQGGGNFVLECGPNLRVEVPRPHQSDSGSQTIPQCRDQTTSPKKSSPDEIYSDDSLESETSFNLLSNSSRKTLATKFYSCQELNSRIVPLYDTTEKQFSSQPNMSSQNRCLSIYDKRISSKSAGPKTSHKFPGVRVERSLEPISRYNICGTNAVYEYDPNKSEPEKVIYSNIGETPVYGVGAIPPVIYPHYQPELFNGLPMSSSDGLTSSDDAMNNSKSQPNESADDNISSGTSSASTGSSIGASDTSSDDFVFMESSVPPVLQTRELYTISENSEPSCSNRSSPLNSRSPRLDTIDEGKRSSDEERHEEKGETEIKIHEPEIKQDPIIEEHKPNKLVTTNEKTPKSEPAVTKKNKVNWAEMECSGNKQFLNFNYKPSPLNGIKRKDQSTEALFPSEDSITFVFVGGKQKETSVLMEVVRRSLLGGSDPADLLGEARSRSRGVQCSSGKLMRSVSVDTAMIALSRLARNQRPFAEMLRTASMSNVTSEQVQVDLDSEIPLTSSESGTQCNITEKVDASSEIRPTDSGCQCDLEKSVTYSLGTSTTTDQETETDAEQKETTTQTDIEELFDEATVELPRRAISPVPGSPGEASHSRQYSSRFSKERWKEMKQLVLGTGRDLFPNYLLSDDTEPTKSRNPKLPRKTVSWSDISVTDEKSIKNETSPSSPDHNLSSDNQPTRRVRFSEPGEERASTLPRTRVPTAETITEFLREATTLLQNLHTDPPGSPESVDVESKTPQKRKYSASCLLRRRRKLLAQIKINRNSPPKILNECSVQTDTETINRFVQTGGLASSLVGPPIRRSLTPNLRREPNDDGDTLNSTWPRRRISAKPPTGLKPNASPRCSTPARSGSASSRYSTGSTTWGEASPLHSTDNSPVHQRSQARAASFSPDQNMNLQIEQSCRRLEAAIEQDRVRQRNLVDCLELYFKDPGSSHVLSARTPSQSPVMHKVNNCNRPSVYAFQEAANNESRHNERETSRSSSSYHYNFTSPEPSKIWNNIEIEHATCITRSPKHEHTKRNAVLPQSWKKNAPENMGAHCTHRERKQQNDFKRYNSEWDNREEMKHPRDFYSNYGTGGNQNFLAPTLPQNIWQGSPRPASPREIPKRTCRCVCHNFNLSCGDMTTGTCGGDRRCHTCCVPCSADPQRPYSSEPSLTPSACDCRPTSRARGSPLAHLRHLIALRRTIVAAEKGSN